jgi:hypothetical protein
VPQAAFESIGQKRSSTQHIVNLLMLGLLPHQYSVSLHVRSFIFKKCLIISFFSFQPVCRWIFEYFTGSKSGHSPSSPGAGHLTPYFKCVRFCISLITVIRPIRVILFSAVPFPWRRELAVHSAGSGRRAATAAAAAAAAAAVRYTIKAASTLRIIRGPYSTAQKWQAAQS